MVARQVARTTGAWRPTAVFRRQLARSIVDEYRRDSVPHGFHSATVTVVSVGRVQRRIGCIEIHLTVFRVVREGLGNRITREIANVVITPVREPVCDLVEGGLRSRRLRG